MKKIITLLCLLVGTSASFSQTFPYSITITNTSCTTSTCVTHCTYNLSVVMTGYSANPQIGLPVGSGCITGIGGIDLAPGDSHTFSCNFPSSVIPIISVIAKTSPCSQVFHFGTVSGTAIGNCGDCYATNYRTIWDNVGGGNFEIRADLIAE